MGRPGSASRTALMAMGLCLWAGPQARAADAPKRAGVDPAAIAALQKMGAFLRAQQSLEVRSETTTDDVLPSGQKVQFGGTVDLKARRPDRLSVNVTSDRKNERLFYDGKVFTVYQPTLGYFASFPAPPTLAGLVDVLEQRYGADLPLADLFRLGADDKQVAAIKAATMVGWSTVKGDVCAHYAFHQSDVDWEIWIQDDAQPLPRKLVITTTSERIQPQHVAVMSWNLTPKLDEQAFVFLPPPNAQRIDFDVSDRAPSTRQGRSAGGHKAGGTP
jgi:hypothetical protein